MKTTEIEIAAAAKAIYRKYGANLSAFWRDAFAAEAQRHGRSEVSEHNVGGNCIHCVPICRVCQMTTIQVGLKDKEQIATCFQSILTNRLAELSELANRAHYTQLAEINTQQREVQYLLDQVTTTAAVSAPAPQPEQGAGEWSYEAMPIHGYRILDENGSEIVRDIYSEEVAARIVDDHTTARTVPGLLRALHDARQSCIQSMEAKEGGSDGGN